MAGKNKVLRMIEGRPCLRALAAAAVALAGGDEGGGRACPWNPQGMRLGVVVEGAAMACIPGGYMDPMLPLWRATERSAIDVHCGVWVPDQAVPLSITSR